MSPSAAIPRVWFITGTSSGLGRALTELILERGEVVVATLRKPSVLTDLASKYPNTILVLPLDVTKPAQIDDAFAKAKDAFGRIDVVVNNAAIFFLGEVEATPDHDGRALLETNFWGAIAVTKAALNFFRESNPPGVGGRLLQVSSIGGFSGGPGAGFYVASKFALEGITESLSKELDPAWNIKLTIIEPGLVDTPIVPGAEQAWAKPHPAYARNPDLPTTKHRHGGWVGEWKDTKRSAELFYKVAILQDPPFRLAVGRDAIVGMRQKMERVAQDLDKYETWSEGLEV